MRRALWLLLAVALVAAACGDDDGAGTDPAAAGSCEELADVGINLVQDAITELDSMELSEFMELAASDEIPEELRRLEDIGTEMEARAMELGCSEEEGDALLCDRVDRLQADGEVGTLIIEGIKSDC
jgi:hypothetical protein